MTAEQTEATENTQAPVADDPQPDLDRLEGAWKELARPFRPEEIEILAKPAGRYDKQAQKFQCVEPNRNATADGIYCGGFHQRSIHLRYVGHAGITMRLNEVDPAWNWEPLSWTPAGLPYIENGALWIKLTVLGVTRLGVGDSERGQGVNAIKEMIGDALRNAAMRFGVGTYLWSKSEKAAQLQAGQFEDEQPAPAPAPQQQPAAPIPTPWHDEAEAKFQQNLKANWNNLANLTDMTRWYTSHTNLPDQHRNALAQRLQELTQQQQQQAGAQA